MIRWVVRRRMQRAIDALNAGDVGPTVRAYADDAVIVFPGDHSWGARYRGKDEIERFFRRAVAAGLQFRLKEVVVSGPPWNMTVCFRLTDRATDAEGREIYSNRIMEIAKGRWGRIAYQEVHLDTQRVAAFDRALGLQDATVTG